MRIIDLSQTIAAGMPGYPGTPPTVVVPVATIAADGYAELRLSLHSHVGTHLDAPAHLLSGGRHLDQFELAAFHGPARVADLTGCRGSTITRAVLQAAAATGAPGEFLLLHTGWSKYWGGEAYFRDYPVLDGEAVAWLASLPLKGVGLDAISIDRLDSSALPNHRALLGRELLIVENLTNLAALPAGPFIFSCLPLKIAQADGAPTRAVAFLPVVPGEKAGNNF